MTGNSTGKLTYGGTCESSVTSFRHAFGDNVVKGSLTVRDANGNTIYREDFADKQAGTTFVFNWDRKDGSALSMPDDVCTVNLSAFNSNGEALLSDQVADAAVTGVINQDGVVYPGMDGGGTEQEKA